MFSSNIGPCVLEYDGTEIGETYGGANFKYTMSAAESKTDKTGETARQRIVTGSECSVTVPLTEATLDQLAVVVPGSDLTAGPTNKALHLQSTVGMDLVDNAHTLILKPIVEGVASTDEEDWTYIPKASVIPIFDVPFKLSDQKVWNVEFMGHPVLAEDVATGGDLYDTDYVEGDVAILGYQEV